MIQGPTVVFVWSHRPCDSLLSLSIVSLILCQSNHQIICKAYFNLNLSINLITWGCKFGGKTFFSTLYDVTIDHLKYVLIIFFKWLLSDWFETLVGWLSLVFNELYLFVSLSSSFVIFWYLQLLWIPGLHIAWVCLSASKFLQCGT